VAALRHIGGASPAACLLLWLLIACTAGSALSVGGSVIIQVLTATTMASASAHRPTIAKTRYPEGDWLNVNLGTRRREAAH
jgi:hypothetical protein